MASRLSVRTAHRARSRGSQGSALWLLLVLAIGALGGIAVASRYLHAQDRLPPDDADEPLFI